MKNQYVILTGSKNNAGDFLIKYRAKELFSNIRPDRTILDLNAWEPFDKNTLNEVNQSKAVLLMGGPSLQSNMRPFIYKMTEDLDDIKVPILSMGIGWKSKSGNWQNTYKYPLSKESEALLERVNNSGYMSSVRDYHTLNAIRFKGYDNFLMTGCPAYYDQRFLNKGFKPSKIKKVAFSLGVSFIESKSMENLMKENILRLKEYFGEYDFDVVFHHSLDPNKYLSSVHSKLDRFKKHQEFEDWLKKRNINVVDISGSADNLLNYYSEVDFHIGYRVHAHIFMNSISKFSILISEDGRAKGVKGVIGGIVLDGYTNFKEGIIAKGLNKLLKYDVYTPNRYLTSEIIDNIKYENKIDFKRCNLSRISIDCNYSIMKFFLEQLP